MVGGLSRSLYGRVGLQHDREALSVGRQIVGIAATEICQLSLGPLRWLAGREHARVDGVAGHHDSPIRGQEEQLALRARPDGMRAAAGRYLRLASGPRVGSHV